MEYDFKKFTERLKHQIKIQKEQFKKPEKVDVDKTANSK